MERILPYLYEIIFMTIATLSILLIILSIIAIVLMIFVIAYLIIMTLLSLIIPNFTFDPEEKIFDWIDKGFDCMETILNYINLRRVIK